jgi:hypothetical protein
MNTRKAVVHITKIAAASRQLDAATRLFFMNEDELAIHTVAAAAFRILRDVSDKQDKNFTTEVFKLGIYNIAKRYAEGTLLAPELKLIENSGIMAIVEKIVADPGFNCDRIEVNMNKAAEQRAWPSKAANFLKHADRDVDEHLPIDEVENEKLLMAGCAAYLHLMRVPTPEIMAYYAFWAAKNDAVAEVGSEARGLAERIVKLPEAKRHGECAKFIQQIRKK